MTKQAPTPWLKQVYEKIAAEDFRGHIVTQTEKGKLYCGLYLIARQNLKDPMSRVSIIVESRRSQALWHEALKRYFHFRKHELDISGLAPHARIGLYLVNAAGNAMRSVKGRGPCDLYIIDQSTGSKTKHFDQLLRLTSAHVVGLSAADSDASSGRRHINVAQRTRDSIRTRKAIHERSVPQPPREHPLACLDLVQVVSGPFAGSRGIVERIGQKNRLQLWLSDSRRRVSAEVGSVQRIGDILPPPPLPDPVADLLKDELQWTRVRYDFNEVHLQKDSHNIPRLRLRLALQKRIEQLEKSLRQISEHTEMVSAREPA